MTKVLLIEDDELTLKVVEFQLRSKGYDVVSNEEGKNISKYFSEVDLVLIDCALPFYSAIEIVSELRKKYNIPVIFMSANSSKLNEAQEHKFEKSAYLSKPLKAKELFETIEQFF